MQTELEKLLDAGEDLIGQIEGMRESVESQLRELGASANEIDDAVQELSRQSDDLNCRIMEMRGEPHCPHDPVAAATTRAIDNLLDLLTTARTDLQNGQNLAAIGALASFDEHAEDLKAAFRLCKMSNRRPS